MTDLKLAGLLDGELLWLAIRLEEECARRFQEMSEAFEFTDGSHSRYFHRMALDEEEHRDRLVGPWRNAGAGHLHCDTVRQWLATHHPDAAEPWDHDEGDLPKALQRGQAIERSCIRFYRAAAHLATAPAVKQLFERMAEDEIDHARWLN